MKRLLSSQQISQDKNSASSSQFSDKEVYEEVFSSEGIQLNTVEIFLKSEISLLTLSIVRIRNCWASRKPKEVNDAFGTHISELIKKMLMKYLN